MKTGLHTARARTRRGAPFRNEASFTAKRLILVEYVQKNGTNKEIRRSGQAEAPRKESIKKPSATRCLRSGNGDGFAFRRKLHGEPAGLRQQPRIIRLDRVRIRGRAAL